jgi:hypothetical protein
MSVFLVNSDKSFYVLYFILVCLSYADIPSLKVRRAGLNVDFAPDPIAYQLNVRNGALILKVNCMYQMFACTSISLSYRTLAPP